MLAVRSKSRAVLLRKSLVDIGTGGRSPEEIVCQRVRAASKGSALADGLHSSVAFCVKTWACNTGHACSLFMEMSSADCMIHHSHALILHVSLEALALLWPGFALDCACVSEQGVLSLCSITIGQ